MAWKKGFNFRSTSAYVTDGADETYVINADVYPVTRNGVTFGWETNSSLAVRDRNSANDRRLAGTHWYEAAGGLFRVDLAATGAHEVRAALGDATAAQATVIMDFRDDATVFSALNDTDGCGSNSFDDATGVARTAAAWAADNLALTRTFVSTIFKLAPNTSVGAEDSIAHIQLEAIEGHPAMQRWGGVPWMGSGRSRIGRSW